MFYFTYDTIIVFDTVLIFLKKFKNNELYNEIQLTVILKENYQCPVIKTESCSKCKFLNCKHLKYGYEFSSLLKKEKKIFKHNNCYIKPKNINKKTIDNKVYSEIKYNNVKLILYFYIGNSGIIYLSLKYITPGYVCKKYK